MIRTVITPTEQADRLAIRELMVAWLRYDDTFVKVDDAWCLADRNLYVDWTETRVSNP